MGYVIAAILVLLIVAAGVTFFVLNASKRERGSAAADSSHGEGQPGSEAAIVAPDDNTPLGDTDQHADEPTEGHGGTTGTTRGSVPPAGAGAGGVGGVGESGEPIRPESERLADRER
jgi:hypothetical protein